MRVEPHALPRRRVRTAFTDYPDRLISEATFAALCGGAPLQTQPFGVGDNPFTDRS